MVTGPVIHYQHNRHGNKCSICRRVSHYSAQTASPRRGGRCFPFRVMPSSRRWRTFANAPRLRVCVLSLPRGRKGVPEEGSGEEGSRRDVSAVSLCLVGVIRAHPRHHRLRSRSHEVRCLRETLLRQFGNPGCSMRGPCAVMRLVPRRTPHSSEPSRGCGALRLGCQSWHRVSAGPTENLVGELLWNGVGNFDAFFECESIGDR